MTFPANPTLEAAPYGPQPVLPVVGPQGGPYNVLAPLQVLLLPSAVRTSSTAPNVQTNYGYKGIFIFLNVTVNPGGAETLLVQIGGVDPLTQVGFNVLQVPATTTPGGPAMLYPGLSGVAVEGVPITRNLYLPPQWYLRVLHSGSGAWTYSLNAVLLP